MYCKYLDKKKFEVHYVGFDLGFPRRNLYETNVHYIPVHRNKHKRYLVYVTTINKLIKEINFDILFLVDCQASLLIRLCNLRRKAILDIRTGDTHLKKRRMSFFNLKILVSSLFFEHITVISDNLRQFLNLSKNKCHYLPLGAELLDLPEKSFDTLTLFYIGTLSDRNIYQTIEGLSLYINYHSSKIMIHYHIVGFGSSEDEKTLLDSIKNNQLSNFVTFHGRKNHDEIIGLFEDSNVGIVYIPITQGYTFQPATKLYEYLLAGMPVIATRTIENEASLGSNDGILIMDTPESFAMGLEEFEKRKSSFNSKKLKQKFDKYTWVNIVEINLGPYLASIC